MEYEELKVPNYFVEIGGYESFTPKDAREYLKWYLAQIPERVKYLAEHVQKFQNNPMDYSLKSLYLLDEWFKTQIEYEYESDEEIMEYCRINYLDENIERLRLSEKVRWTYYTTALMYDVAMYYGEVMVRNINGMKWGVKTRSKSYVYRNRPIVINENVKYFNVFPINFVKVTMAHHIDDYKLPNSFEDMFLQYIDEFGLRKDS